ncbi:MAG: hypothetical protein ACOCRO_04475 [Halanaerobiales bacterium]
MKRNKKKRHPSVSGPYKTLFPVLSWKECHSCGKEVRFERMYFAFTPPIINGFSHKKYLCQDCSPDKETAYEYFHLSKPGISKIPNIPLSPQPRPQPGTRGNNNE